MNAGTTRRRRVNPEQAASAAAHVVPDPKATAAPPIESDVDPWDGVSPDPAEVFATPTEATTEATSETRRGWGSVISTVLDLDPAELYERLTKQLSLGNDATEYGAVLAALDRAERNAFDAVRLARHAKLEDERVAREVAERLEVLRTAARNELAAEVDASKDEKGKASRRAATLQDVEDRVMANWPDESRSLERRKAEMHAALRATEGLADAWRSRCASLRVITERVAPTRPR